MCDHGLCRPHGLDHLYHNAADSSSRNPFQRYSQCTMAWSRGQWLCLCIPNLPGNLLQRAEFLLVRPRMYDMLPSCLYFNSLNTAQGYLIKEQTLCDASIKVFPDYIGFYDTPFTVTIPPTVGPSGAHYTLIGRIINTDGSYYGSTWESDVFKLDGANGTWANYQMNNRQLWGDDGISCSGFACVKDCAGTETGFGGTGTTDGSYQSCANACPGVYIDPSSSVGGQPTASLTRPPVCPETSQASRNGNSLIPLRTLSRTPAEPTATVASDTSDARFLSSKSWVTMAMALMAVGWTISQK